MIRVVVALFVMGVGAIAWVLLVPDPAARSQVAVASKGAAPVAPPAGTMADAAPAPAEREVRVVYPGPSGTAPVRKLADKVESATNLIAPAAAATMPGQADAASSIAVPAPQASAAPMADGSLSAASSVTSADPASPTATGLGQAVNINTASVDALNGIPGAGRIGRTIASHRPYKSIDELLSKRVVRKSVYDKIKDQIAAN